MPDGSGTSSERSVWTRRNATAGLPSQDTLFSLASPSMPPFEEWRRQLRDVSSGPYQTRSIDAYPGEVSILCFLSVCSTCHYTTALQIVGQSSKLISDISYSGQPLHSLQEQIIQYKHPRTWDQRHVVDILLRLSKLHCLMFQSHLHR